MAHKAKNIYSVALYRKGVLTPFTPWNVHSLDLTSLVGFDLFLLLELFLHTFYPCKNTDSVFITFVSVFGLRSM